MSTVIERLDRSFWFVMKDVLNYAGSYELQYSVSFVESRIKNIVGDMTPPRNLPKQSRSSNIRYLRLGRLMKKNAKVFLLLPLLNESRITGRELRICHLESKVLRTSRAISVVPWIEAADVCINNPTKSSYFHVPIFYPFGEQLLQNLYDLHDEFNKSLKPSPNAFTNGK